MADSISGLERLLALDSPALV
jgi:hypothetical protein